MTTSAINVGFLLVQQESNGYVGAYFVTNCWGRPLDFRLSSAVQPNRVQQILYAGTLAPYLCGELIGKTLVDKSSVPASLVLTTCEHALEMRPKVDFPVVLLLDGDDARSRSALAVEVPGKRLALLCHPTHPEDVATVRELLTHIEGIADLTEPFTRIREAIVEARKTGVTGRLAA